MHIFHTAFAGLGWVPKEGGWEGTTSVAATGLVSVAGLHFLHSWSFKLRLWRWTTIIGTHGDGVFQCPRRLLSSHAFNFRGLLLNLGCGVITSGFVFLFFFFDQQQDERPRRSLIQSARLKEIKYGNHCFLFQITKSVAACTLHNGGHVHLCWIINVHALQQPQMLMLFVPGDHMLHLIMGKLQLRRCRKSIFVTSQPCLFLGFFSTLI